METIVVETKYGKIKGILNEDSSVFRYVPYALTKRFEDPKPYYFKEEYDATVRGYDCYQEESFYEPKGFYAKEYPYDNTKKYNDEITSLTITTPDINGKYPVLVFIHGGAFTSGCVEDLPYGDSKEFAKRGIVLVSIGYRLNVFAQYNGGNFGLKDQLFALKWIKENIESFGGNKDSIVICGQSAGAMSICDLLYIDEVENLIKGAIIMSGAGAIPKIMHPYLKEDLKPLWDEINKKLNEKGLDPNTCNAKDLFDAYNSSYGKYKTAILPCVDKELIKDYPHILSKQNKVVRVPLLLGITAQDMFSVLMYNMTLSFGLKHSDNAYAYFFNHPLPGDEYKSFHSCDLWYAFNNMDKAWRPFNENDYRLSKLMSDYFANFVKYQNPNGDNLPKWEKLSKKQKGFFLFDDKANGKLIYPTKCRLIQLKALLFDKKVM